MQLNKKIVVPALLATIGGIMFFMTGKKQSHKSEKEEKENHELPEDEATARLRIAREWAAEQGRKGAQKRWAKKKADIQEPVNDGAGVQS